MDKKISDLNAATALTGTEVLPIVQGGETKKVTAKAISELGGAVAIGQVAFGTAAGVIGGDAGFTWDNTNKRFGVGTSSPTARLHVQAPGALSTDIAFRVRNSADTGDIIRANGAGDVFIGNSTIAFGGTGAFPGGIFAPSVSLTGAFANTTGTSFSFDAKPFLPTSGTGVYNCFSFTNVINQTGGANGITRGLFINPTLTAAADFRAIETTKGKVIFGNLPTSPTGLPTGAIWNDAGTLKIV